MRKKGKERDKEGRQGNESEQEKEMPDQSRHQESGNFLQLYQRSHPQRWLWGSSALTMREVSARLVVPTKREYCGGKSTATMGVY